MATTNVSIRMDSDLKAQADALFACLLYTSDAADE